MIFLALAIGLLSEFLYSQVLASEAVYSFYLLMQTEPHKFPVLFDSPYERIHVHDIELPSV